MKDCELGETFEKSVSDLTDDALADMLILTAKEIRDNRPNVLCSIDYQIFNFPIESIYFLEETRREFS